MTTPKGGDALTHAVVTETVPGGGRASRLVPVAELDEAIRSPNRARRNRPNVPTVWVRARNGRTWHVEVGSHEHENLIEVGGIELDGPDDTGVS